MVPVTVTESAAPATEQDAQRLSLSTGAARNLATTTKSVPQMQGISPRWLLRRLSWVEAKGGAYRVNRRTSYALGDGRVSFTNVGAEVRVIPRELRELAALRDFDDEDALTALADRFQQREHAAGEVIAEYGNPIDAVFLIAHGKVSKIGSGEYGEPTALGTLADGECVGERALLESEHWEFSVKTLTPCIVLALPRRELEALTDQSEALRGHLDAVRAQPKPPVNKHGEAEISLTSGHDGEPLLPGTYVDYESSPREYELSVAQTVLRVHSRVADLYNDPMNQVEQQLRLTVEALRERQEQEMINSRDFGLLHNADLKQRIHTRTGPPTPYDMDELLSRRRKTKLFLAHPRAIAAIGRECSKHGLYPQHAEVDGSRVMTWRGVPIFPCDKIPITETNTSSIIAMRTGVDDDGVIGLRQTGIPDELEPGLNVRFMGISDQGILSYLVSTYYSVAVLVPNALGVLEHVELGGTGG